MASVNVTGRPDVGGHVEHRLQRLLVVGGQQVGNELDEPAACVVDAAGDGLDLGLGGVVARDRLAALGLVDGQPRRREAKRANRDRLGGQLAHQRQVLGRSPVRGRPRAGPSRTPAAASAAGTPPRRCRACPRRGRRGIREGLPRPRQAVDHDDAGDVLDAGHHVDQRRRGPRRGTGANPTPQLPITAVVTPCAEDGVIRSDQMAWPS